MKEFAKRIFVAAIVIGAIVLTAYVVKWLFLILAGVLLAILFRTIATWLSDRANISFTWAITIVLVVAAGLLLGTIWEFGSQMVSQADQLMTRLSEALTSLQQRTERYENLHRIFSHQSLNLIEPTESLITTMIWTIAAMILVLFVAAYTSINPEMYADTFVRLFPQGRRNQVRTVLVETGSALRWWLFGQLIVMAVVGIITAVGLLIINVPMALPLAFLAAVLTFVPYLGAIVSAIPALMVGFTVNTHTALYVAVVFLIAHVAEGYVVMPTIQHRFLYLPPALILANQFLMQLLAGFIGLAFATPFLVVVMVVVKRLYFREGWGSTEEAA